MKVLCLCGIDALLISNILSERRDAILVCFLVLGKMISQVEKQIFCPKLDNSSSQDGQFQLLLEENFEN